VIVGVEGQLIAATAELKQKVPMPRGRRSQFVIDFSKTGYIDSSGPGVWLASKKIREQGGSCGSPASTRTSTLFELTSSTRCRHHADRRGGARRVLSLRLDVTSSSRRLDVRAILGDGWATPSNWSPLTFPPVGLSTRRISSIPHRPREASAMRFATGTGRSDRVVPVYVELRRDFVRIHVDDDGQGFDPAASRSEYRPTTSSASTARLVRHPAPRGRRGVQPRKGATASA